MKQTSIAQNIFTSSRKLGLATSLAALIAASTAPALVGAAVANSTDDWVGVAAAIKGNVQLTSLQAAPHRPSSGERLFMGDQITSGENSHLQILLRDKTTFTLGPDCDLTIDKFVYDPASKSGEIQASVTKGAFRFVTGEIPHKDPDALNIKIPSGTIGVRGTIGEAVVGAAAIAIAEGSGIDISNADPNLAVLVVLRGPGNNLNTGDRVGQVVVSSGGENVTLSRPNWASFIAAPSVPPSPAFEIPQEMQTALAEALHPGGAAPGEEGEKDSAGNGKQKGDDEGSQTSEIGSAAEAGVSADAGQEVAAGEDLKTLQYGAEERQLVASTETQPNPNDGRYLTGPTRPDEFLSRQGTAMYQSTNVPMTDGGTYDYTAIVNFDARTLGSIFQWSGTSVFDDQWSETTSVDLSGQRVERSGTLNFGPGQSATTAETLLNENGNIGTAIRHSLVITDTNTSATSSGSGVAQ